MLSIQSLPREIINNLIRFLDLEDILNLGECLDFDVTKATYDRFFHDETHFQHYNLKMLAERAKVRIFVLGDLMGGGRDSRYFARVKYDGIEFQRMHTPVPIPCSVPVTKVTCGKWVYILTTAGKLYFTGVHIQAGLKKLQGGVHPRETSCECPLVDVTYKRMDLPSLHTSHNVPDVDLKLIHTCENMYRRYLTDTTYVPRIVDFETCFGLVRLLDDSGLVREVYQNGVLDMENDLESAWLVENKTLIDYGEKLEYLHRLDKLWIYCEGHGRDRSVIQQPVRKIRNFSTLFQDRGLAFVYGIYSPDGGNVNVSVNECYIVPNTAAQLKDWLRIEQGILCIKENGTVFFVEAYLEDSAVLRHPFTVKKIHRLAELNKMGPFVQVGGNSRGFYLLTSMGKPIFVRVVPEGDTVRFYTQVSAEFSDIACISVGGTHILALTNDGEVYAWGKEADLNGCLGLGTLNEALELGARIEPRKTDNDYTYLVLDKPTKIKLPGKAYAIYAGEVESVVLCE